MESCGERPCMRCTSNRKGQFQRSRCLTCSQDQVHHSTAPHWPIEHIMISDHQKCTPFCRSTS
jgi:hypothetical protein